MIGSLSGKLLQRRHYSIIIEVQGVGYETYLSESDHQKLPPAGSALFLWTHLHVKEPQWTLFGFFSLQKRDLFRHLLGINGMGPKLALACVGTLEPNDFIQIASSNACEKLEAVPGIGKKLAARLMLELNAIIKKMFPTLIAATAEGKSVSALPTPEKNCISSPWIEETVRALKGLGYKEENVIRTLATKIWNEHRPATMEVLLKKTLQRCDHHSHHEIKED